MSTIKANTYLDAAGGNTATINGAVPASLASPALTGTPTAPTASVGTNTTQIATTAFVLANGGLGGINIQGFTASGTYTPTAGYKYAIAILTGGGQSGSGATGPGYGGAGSAAPTVITAFTISGSQSVTVGAGGAATFSGTKNNGGASSIGSIASVSGGGQTLAYNGTIIIPGATINGGTNGGSSFWGQYDVTGYNNPGAYATLYGVGGGAGYVPSGTSTGGAGGPGIVMIWEFK